MDGSGGAARDQPAASRVIRSIAMPLCGAATTLQLACRTCDLLPRGQSDHPNRGGGGCESQLATALPNYAARTEVILTFIVGAYGAGRIRRVSVAP